MFATTLLASWIDNLPHVPAPLALAVVALLGYLVGRLRRSSGMVLENQVRRELERAQHVANELERVAESIRQNLSKHNSSVERFKDRLKELHGASEEESWKQLCREAEDILRPTLRLANEISHGYDEIRRQSTMLMALTEVRTDPLTGLRNRRALDEALETMFAMKTRYDQPFAIVMFDLDYFKKVNDEHGHVIGDQVLRGVAGLLDDGARSTDIVVRYGGEEFIVVMPQTDLDGAMLVATRLRRAVEQTEVSDMKVTISGGIAVAIEGEDARSLLSRADKALYCAKELGRNRVCVDNGVRVTLATEEESPEMVVSSTN